MYVFMNQVMLEVNIFFKAIVLDEKKLRIKF